MSPIAACDRYPSGTADRIDSFESLWSTTPPPDQGYRVGDVATGLVVMCRAGAGIPPTRLAWGLQDLLRRSQRADGRVGDRCGVSSGGNGGGVSGDGTVQRLPDGPGVREGWGRALWGLGTAAARGREPELCRRAMEGFDLGCGLRSPWPRTMAFAGLGAAEVLRVDSWHAGARALLAAAAAAVAGTGAGYPAWPWPASRLGHANAVVPDVLLAAGETLDDPALVTHGLALLGWLLDLQTASGHLSVVPAGGWSPGEPWPGADQRPAEVSGLADACARAFELTDDARWLDAVRLCAAWFFGDNDAGVVLADPDTGGCRDALRAGGRDEPQGTGAALALISTLQHVNRLRAA